LQTCLKAGIDRSFGNNFAEKVRGARQGCGCRHERLLTEYARFAFETEFKANGAMRLPTARMLAPERATTSVWTDLIRLAARRSATMS